jgi:hypothetical protein
LIVSLYYNIKFYLNKKYSYLKPTDACQTKASNRKNKGIAGNTSTIGLNAAKASGNLETRIVVIISIIF